MKLFLLLLFSGIAAESTVWKELEENATMPVGSHVKFDLANGKKYLNLSSVEGYIEETGASAECHEDCSVVSEKADILMKLPSSSGVDTADLKRLKAENLALFEEKVEEIWQKRQEEVREAMEAMAEEVSILETLISQLKEPNADVLPVLEEIESMVSDIDHASTFLSLGGVKAMANLLDNENIQDQVTQEALLVLGSASKYFEDAQKEVLASGTLQKVLSMFSKNCEAEDSSLSLCPRIVYTMGAFLRGSPENIEFAKEQEFLMAASNLLAKDSFDQSSKFAVKLRNLLSDLDAELSEG